MDAELCHGPAMVRADARMVLLAIELLIKHALVHAKPVSVTLQRDDAGWVLAVHDVQPREIPASHRAKVFDLFERLGGGDGVALATVRKIIERHGFGIALEPRDEGHAVRLTFPWGHA